VPITSLLVEVARGLAANCGLNRRVDVAARQPVTRGCLPVDIDAQRRLAERREDRKIGHTAYFAHRGFDLVGGFRQHDDVVADQLDRVLAFDPGYCFLDVVLDVLREVEVDAWQLRLQSFIALLDALVLGHTLAPFLCRLERGKEFGVEEAGGIGAVIGPSLLGYDRLDFGKIPDHQPHAVDEVMALLERDRRRHGCANPEIALLQVGRNSRPSNRTANSASANSKPVAASAKIRCATANSTIGLYMRRKMLTTIVSVSRTRSCSRYALKAGTTVNVANSAPASA